MLIVCIFCSMLANELLICGCKDCKSENNIVPARMTTKDTEKIRSIR
jgi:hypothetical protein